jgi:hypothetical protein
MYGNALVQVALFLLSLLFTICSSVRVRSSTELSQRSSTDPENQAEQNGNIATIRTQLQRLEARHALKEVDPAITTLKAARDTEGKVISKISLTVN